MSNEGLKVAVLGTGNSGQAFAADLTLKDAPSISPRCPNSHIRSA